MFGVRKQTTKWHKWLISFVFVGLLWPGIAYQQAPFVGCNPTPSVDANGIAYILNQCTFTNLLEVPVRIYNWVLSLAGIIFLGVVIWGGARMMLFYASESPETELNDAKMTIRRGIFGLLIVAFSYLIVNVLVYTIFGLSSSSGVGGWLSSFGL